MRTMAFVNSVSSLIWSVAPLLVTLITFTGSFLTLECMSFVIGLSKTWLSLYISWRSKYIGCTKNFQMSYFVQYYEISDDHASKCYQLGTKSTSFTQASFQSNLGIITFCWAKFALWCPWKSVGSNMKTFSRRIEKFLHLPELEENDFKNESKSWIQIENGNFNWGDDNTTLKNINLEVQPNKLVAIVGSVGSGKSSLVQVMVKNDRTY